MSPHVKAGILFLLCVMPALVSAGQTAGADPSRTLSFSEALDIAGTRSAQIIVADERVQQARARTLGRVDKILAGHDDGGQDETR